MNNVPDGSPLTASQRRDLEQKKIELRSKYDSLTKDINAVDIDISQTLEEYRKRPLQERREQLMKERYQVTTDMAAIESELQTKPASTLPTSELPEKPTNPPVESPAPSKRRRGWWRGGMVVIGGLCVALVALILAGAIRSPTVVVLRTHYGTYVTALNGEDGRDWELSRGEVRSESGITDREKFTLGCVEGGNATLETYYDNFVTAMDANGDWVLRAATDERKASELFTLLDAQNGTRQLTCSDVIKQVRISEVTLVLKTAHERYVTAGDGSAEGDWRIWADKAETLRDEQRFAIIMQ